MSSKATPPLVSVVVRSMGRPTLDRTLARIAAQTHRPLEIVLVHASGSPSEPATLHIPVVNVRQGPLDRPRAANAGLDAARGDWVIFLDEDDEIESTHVSELLNAMAVSPGARAAYSQTRLVDAAGATQRIFGGPFDRLALFRSNYFAIHAVLFERSLVADGCRFDESFAMFEDWDFWLQVAMRTSLAFTGRPTAIYHASSGESGAGAGSNLDRNAVLAQRERLMHKWEAARRALAIASGSN
jgi:glycosyltransferase involved in cell wall biosynthesis